ncbi:MAG: LuxR C-terminal-related transcriptional regulator [Bacteroidales bacterium]|jgi:DNA-binding NarL/FixJ family response regulator|nr:LuxR C-terminal-related transcriptional regulator [Bacteroidales bacterium]
MKSVYIAVKSKKLSNDFCTCIDKSDYAKVTATFNSLKECKKKLSDQLPDILILGLDLTDGYWVDFCTEIRKKHPALKILIITSYEEYSVFKIPLNNLSSGYISKDALPKVIISAIQAVLEGKFFRYDKMVVPQETEESEPEKLLAVIQQKAQMINNDSNSQDAIENLSQLMDATEKYRRLKIKNLIADKKDELDSDCLDQYIKLLIESLLVKGYPNWDIADTLNINIETVRIYRMEFILNISGQNSMILNKNRNKESIPLGRREQQLLRLIAAGYTNEEIANDILYVDIETVKTIRKNLILKFDAKNAMSMVISALRLGLIKIEDIEV